MSSKESVENDSLLIKRYLVDTYRMMTKLIPIEAGDLLLAEPFLYDPHFHRAVVCICEHTEEGTTGFIINRPLDMKLNELIPDMPDFEVDVHYGGPVGNDTLHYVHNVGELLEESIEITEGVYWGGNFEKLKFLIDSKLILPHNIRFFVGYSGWSTEQLQEELKEGSWVRSHVNREYVFDKDPFDLWKLVMQDQGDVFSILAELPETELLN